MPVSAEDVQARIAAVEAAAGTTVEADAGGAPPAPTAEPVVPAPVAEPTAPVADPFDNAETTTFDRAYVERLRSESAEHRTKLKTYEDFDKLDPTRRDAWITIAKTMETNPAQAYAWLDEIVKAGNIAPPANEPPAPTAPGGNDFLTRADMDRIMGERDAALAEKRMIDDTYAEMRELKLDPESTDLVESAIAVAVLKVASLNGGDIKAAYKQVVEDTRQKAIDDYVAGKAAQSTIPGSTAPAGAIPSQERTRPEGMDPMKWARLNALERLNARQA